MLETNQDPSAAQALTEKVEFEFAAVEGVLRRLTPDRLPIAAIPELDRAAAIFALRDRAFKITVIERMVFDLDRKATIMWVDRWAARHRPGFEDPVEFEPQIIVKPPSGMLLHNKAQPLRGSDSGLSARLLGLAEIAFGAVLGELGFRHFSRTPWRRDRLIP